MSILGLTWAFGFTYFADGSQWLAIVFTILNSSQGVWILVFHVLLNKKAVKEVGSHLSYMTNRVKVSFLLPRPAEPRIIIPHSGYLHLSKATKQLS